jgi:hypothetical protein
MQEIFMTTGVTSTSAQGWGGVFEDAATGRDQLVYNSNTWEYYYCGYNCGHRAGKGDIDGDDRDEIVVVAWVPSLSGGQLRLTVVDYGPAGYTTTVTPLASNIGRRFDTMIADDLMSLAVGDFDDDGLDEIAFTLFNCIWVFDDALHGHAQLAKVELSPPGAQWPVATVWLAVGRFYEDGKERLVEVHNFREGHEGSTHSGVWIQIFDDAQLAGVRYSAYHPYIGPKDDYFPKWISTLDTGDSMPTAWTKSCSAPMGGWSRPARRRPQSRCSGETPWAPGHSGSGSDRLSARCSTGTATASRRSSAWWGPTSSESTCTTAPRGRSQGTEPP